MTETETKFPAPRTRGWPDPFDAMHDELDRLFGGYFKKLPIHRFGFSGDGNGSLFANLDIGETDDDLTIEIDVPGVKREDIDITLSDNTLRVKGRRESKKEEKEKSYQRVERESGAFERRIALPCEVDTDAVDAGVRDGVLTITLPKSAKAKEQERKIEIHT